MHVPTLCDWFSSSASAYDSDNLVSIDRKRSQNAVFTRLLSPKLLITTPILTPPLVKTSLKKALKASPIFNFF